MTPDPLFLTALGLATTHFDVPLAYYLYLRSKWLNKPWDVKRDSSYRPRVTIIVPTYNEADLIESKLDDIARQDYPKELVEVIVIDSASADGTPKKVEKWAHKNPDVKLTLIREPVRRGKASALNHALKHASGDVVVITDVDATWTSNTTLSNAILWLSDPAVGAVTCLKLPADKRLDERRGGLQRVLQHREASREQKTLDAGVPRRAGGLQERPA